MRLHAAMALALSPSPEQVEAHADVVVLVPAQQLPHRLRDVVQLSGIWFEDIPFDTVVLATFESAYNIPQF